MRKDLRIANKTSPILQCFRHTQVPTGRYVVPTGKVIVPTGRYVVPTGKVIVPTGRDIWNAVKARFGGNAKSKKMRKSMLKQEFLEFRTGDAGEFAHMGVTSETTKKELHTKLDNNLVQTEKWRNSSKNLFKLIDSSVSVITKVGLGFTNCIIKNELGWDDSAFSVFTTNSEDVEGRPIFHMFAKTDSMKDVPPPLTGDYTSLSDHTDLDESQMSYGTKFSTSCEPKYVPNDFVSCDESDKSSEINTNDFAFSNSCVRSLKYKPTDSTSCASTSSDLPSFTCNSSDKNEHTSRTPCNKNGSFNKKASHFRKNASSVSKLCFVCGSGTHLIKDCDFYKKQMTNKTVGIGVGPVHSRNKVNHQNQFVPQAVLLRTGKIKIPPARPQPVPTGKPKVFALVPAGRLNRPFPVPTDRGYSPSVISGWWLSTASPMPHLINPTSFYFQTYTPYVPTISYNHMKYEGDRWATPVKPSAGCSWKSHKLVPTGRYVVLTGRVIVPTGRKLQLMIIIGQREVTTYVGNDWSKIMTTFIIDMLEMIGQRS
nr:hypothetical protein [Tanacetum cinerariifolium]